ncbi:MAG TPA: zinc ribbon domain-containing protein [Nitrospirales bacterium]|nr:hypothetical protein [Nitrospiraceae bacterium]HNP31153.1 zinc ribbon domain-containing protein [Nitrospirales bacterium]
MPVYEYKCTQCGEQAEKKFSIASRADLIACKMCDGEMRRIPSSFGTSGKSSTTHTAPNLHATKNFQSANPSRGTGLSIGVGQNIKIENCTFRNMGVGISMSDEAKVQMSGIRFEKVNFPLEVKND